MHRSLAHVCDNAERNPGNIPSFSCIYTISRCCGRRQPSLYSASAWLFRSKGFLSNWESASASRCRLCNASERLSIDSQEARSAG
jgi:hypothetical protein